MSLAPALALGGGRRPLWIDAVDYAADLLLPGGEIPWGSVPDYVAFEGRAAALLRSDVTLLDVARFLAAAVDRQPALAAAMLAKPRPTWPLRCLLGDAAAADLLAELVAALAGAARGRPLLLQLPAPDAWLAALHARLGSTCPAPDAADAEDAAAYVADALRPLSAAGVAGLVIDAPGLGPPAALLTPILNTSAHYRWGSVLRGGGADVGDAEAFDAVVGAARPPAALCWGAELGGLEAGDAPAGADFLWVSVPRAASPEAVLARLAALRR